jgi:hypothetical protein
MDPACHQLPAASSNAGMQIPVIDIDADSDFDIVIALKTRRKLFRHRRPDT